MAASTWSRAVNAAPAAALAAPAAALASADASTLGSTGEPIGNGDDPAGVHAARAIATIMPAAAPARPDRCGVARPSRRTSSRSMVALRGATARCVSIGAPYGPTGEGHPPRRRRNVESGSQLASRHARGLRWVWPDLVVVRAGFRD